jgi:hypothetical protein
MVKTAAINRNKVSVLVLDAYQVSIELEKRSAQRQTATFKLFVSAVLERSTLATFLRS